MLNRLGGASIIAFCLSISVFAQEPASFAVVGRYPLEGQALADQIVLYFSQPIDAASAGDTPLNWTPPLEGTYEIGPAYIAFRPDPDALRRKTQYTATISPELKAASGTLIRDDERRYVFPTHEVRLKHVRVREQRADGVLLELLLSDEVGVNALRTGGLGVVDAGGVAMPVWVEVLPMRHAYGVTIPADARLPVTLTLNKGVKDTRGVFQTGRRYDVRFPNEAPLNVESSVWKRMPDGREIVTVRFSAPVNSEQFKKSVQWTNAADETPIAFKVQPEGDYQELALEARRGLDGVERTMLQIEGTLFSADLRKLRQPHEAELTRTLDQLRITHHRWEDRGVDGPVLSITFNGTLGLDALKGRIRVEPEAGELTFEPGNYREMWIHGDWKGETSYTVTLEQGIEDQSGTLRLDAPLTYALGETPRAQGIEFAHADKYYFPHRHEGTLVLRSVNEDSATLTVHRLFPSNIAAAVDALYGANTNPEFDRRFSEKVGEVSVELPDVDNERTETAVDLAELLGPDARGVFTVELQPHREWDNTKVVVWTDLGAIAHWQADELAVFVHELKHLTPVAGATVTVYSDKNQIMCTGSTDTNGIVRVQGLNTRLGSPRAAVIETGSDYTFLKLENDVPGDLPHAGLHRYDREAYDVYMYADRNLYRPGEPVHLQWIVRTDYGDALANVPLQFLLYNPNGQRTRQEAIPLSEFGTGGIDLQTSGTDPTGAWLAELRVPGNEVALQTHTFHLEEFVPNRIETSVRLGNRVWTAGQSQVFHVFAENLFGGPARNRTSEGTLIFRRGTYASEAWPDFRFGNDTRFDPVIQSLGEAQTDSDGSAAFAFDGRGPANATFPVDVRVRGEVRELGGRAVTDSAHATYFPSDIALGVAASGTPAGDAVVVDVAAIRPDDSPADLDAVTVTFERRTWHYFVRRYRGYNEPSWTESYEPIAEEEVVLSDGRGRTQFSVPGHGYYRVRVHSDKTPQFSTSNFYKFWQRIETMDSGARDLVTLTSDASSYRPGDIAVVRVESPFGGKAVVCVQGESIYDYFTVDLVDNKADVRIPIDAAYRPNVWAEVTVVHEVDRNAGETHPFASFAMVNLPVDAPERKLDVSLSALPTEVRPNQVLPVTVRTADHRGNPVSSLVTLAAVDEGIHAILDYKTPDPFAWFDRSRAPDLNRAEYYDQVAYDFEPAAIGGDVMKKRLGQDPSVGENWIKPVALWTGPVRTDSDGRATVDVDLPEFNGRLRIVAVAATATATGAYEDSLLVRRPYMLRTSLPRFVLPGDEFECSAVLFNTTNKPVNVRLEWSASGVLQESSNEKQFEVPAQGEQQIHAGFTASPAVGPGVIEWRATITDAGGAVIETVEERMPLPVRQPAVFQSNREFAVLQPGESRTFSNAVFLDNDLLESRITVSANPALRLQRALDELIGYPYGCLEQTVSRAMPLYLLNKTAVSTEPMQHRNAEVVQYVQNGIDRIFSMQTPSGGIGFWPGSNDPYPYGSVYAAHFLVLTRRDPEFAVPAAQWDALREYVTRVGFAEDDGSASARYNRAYALYVLALDGSTEAMDQISRFDAVKMPESARYLLAAAIAMNTGDPQRAQDYLADAPTMAYEGRETSGTLNSEIRSVAVELLALIEMDAAQAELAARAEVLSRFLDNARYPNTQDLAFAATALGRYIESLEQHFDNARFAVASNDDQATLTGTTPYRDETEGAASEYRIVNEGGAPVFIDFVTAGIPTTVNMDPVSEGIEIERLVRAGHSGERVTTEFEHGDTYVVTLRLTTKQHLENVVVADLLPAGFEIENPRLDADAVLAMNIQESTLRPSHLEVRDDRLITAFDTIAPGKYRFHYVVRAVTPGSFTWPSVHAECMYDPAVRGRNAPGTVEITSQ